MCGRFTLFESPEVIKDELGLAQLPLFDESYNIAPTQNILAIYNDGSVRMPGSFRWGLIPFWAKDIKIGNKLINARLETIREKPAFRSSFKTKRCIIAMSGFYEWQNIDGIKRPQFISSAEHRLMLVAGIYDDCLLNNERIRSCSLITTEANECVQSVHHRMPLMLEQADIGTWLSPHQLAEDSLKSITAKAKLTTLVTTK